MGNKKKQDSTNSPPIIDAHDSAELIIANKKLAMQIEDKEKRAAELVIANTELAFQNAEKENRAAELVIANIELAFQNTEKEKRASELIIANAELIYQNKEKEKRAAELVIANKKLVFENDEKEKRAAELSVANKKLVFENEEKEKRAAELIIANYARSLIEASLDPLVTISATGKILDVNEASIKVTGVAREKLIDTNFSNYFTEPKKAQEGYRQAFEKGFVEDYPLTIKHKNGNLTDVLYNASVYKDNKGNVLGVFAAARDVTEQKWAKDLRIANKELAFQNTEKENRASELIVANAELIYQNKEKEKRAAELVIANTELAFQNTEKENRAAELVIANTELIYQNTEKENRAAELVIANTELINQNNEKENLAAELVIANTELAFQNTEKENRAAELVIANTELAFQNIEKENRAAELLIANKELESFAFISSHDLQEPLRKIQTFSSRILDEEYGRLSEKGKYSFDRIQNSALRMQTLIQDLLVYSRTTVSDRKFEKCDLNTIVKEVMETLKEELREKQAVIELFHLGEVNIIPFQFRQLLQNLITNSVKFRKTNEVPRMTIKGNYIKYAESTISFQTPVDHYHIEFSDNGIGFDSDYNEKIFELFQRLHKREDYEGTGIGLTIVKKIVNNHNGLIIANGELGRGAQFDIYIPA